MAKPTIEPITDATLAEFAAFLEAHMPARRAADDWVRGLATHWGETRPNYGFLMRDQGEVVGGIGALYADRVIRGQPERFCNITSWCVLDSHRKYGMQLAMAIVGQAGYHFTDFSPTRVVAGVLQFLNFRALDEGVAVIPNLPWLLGSGRVVTDPREIERLLPAAQAAIWRDHRAFPWLVQLIVGEPSAWCHVIYKRRRFKGMACADIVYVSDAPLFSRYLGGLCRHFLRRGMTTTHVETRMLESPPRLSRIRRGFIAKQYLSPTLAPADIDYLYSETVALDL